MSSRYPPGMSMRDFDRANHDSDEECDHGNWRPECNECRADDEADAADLKRDEIREREYDPDF